MFLAGLSVQKRVVHALFLRELKTRFGKYRLGYLWALMEPLAHLAVLMVIFGYVMTRAMPGIPFLVFLLNGLMPWFLFSKVAVRSLSAIEANRGLLSYRPVHPIDTLLARALLEILLSFIVYIILMVALWFFGMPVTLSDMPRIVFLWLLILALSTGVGLFFMVIGHAIPESQKFLPLFMRPLYFMSGIMYSLTVIPKDYQYLVDWNPLLHGFELLRQTVVPTYQTSPDISMAYLIQWAVIILAMGLILYKGREPAIRRS